MPLHDMKFNFHLGDSPGLNGHGLAHTPWKIVRPANPEELAGMALVNPLSVLAEGISDDKGHVKLTAEQEKSLAKEFSERPVNIWMMYPGQAVQLEVHQEQPDWTEEQKMLYALSAMDYSDDLYTSKYGEEARHDKKRGLKDMLLRSGDALYNKLKK